jgi:hypothetical protein
VGYPKEGVAFLRKLELSVYYTVESHAFQRYNPWKVLTFHGLSVESFLFYEYLSKIKTKFENISRR